MKEEQKYSQHYSSCSEEIPLTPSHIKAQKRTNNITFFEYDKAHKSMEQSMTNYKQNNLANQLEKLELIKLLLNTLGYSKSAKVLQKEARVENSCRNPEKSSNKKPKQETNKESLELKIQHILHQNISFQEMLDSLVLALKEVKQQKMIEEIVDQNQTSNVLNHHNLQKAVQIMFPKTQTITIPVYKSLQVDCLDKLIRFADINSQQDVCILDNQNTLSIIEEKDREKVMRTMLEQKRHIIDMKWVNSHLIVLLTSNNKVLLYNKKLENIKTIRSYKIPIMTHTICVIKNSPTTQYLYILSASKHLLVPFKINIDDGNINEESLPTFETQHELMVITPIKVPHRVTFHRPLSNYNQETQFNIVTEIEHFYGLTDKMRKIVKFDSIVEQSGIIWQCPHRQFVCQMKTSECGHFLQMLIVRSKNATLQKWQVEKVSFVKMSASGCILQRLELSLKNICRDIFIEYKFMSGKLCLLNSNMRWLKLNPYWVRCFAHNNFIYYVSLKTGNLLFSQQIQSTEIKLLCAGNENALLYQSNGKLKMLSTKDNTKKNVSLQNRRNPDLRQSLIQRFSRLHGIPQNLLLLLRTIRNNDIELQEISE